MNGPENSTGSQDSVGLVREIVTFTLNPETKMIVVKKTGMQRVNQQSSHGSR